MMKIQITTNKFLLFGLITFLIIIVILKYRDVNSRQPDNIHAIDSLCFSVEGVRIKHFIKREGCRISRFELIVNVKNRGATRRILRFYPVAWPCDRDIDVDTSQIYWLVSGRRIPLFPLNVSDSLVVLEPSEERKLYFKTIFYLFGISLSDIYTYYSSWINDSFSLLYIEKDKSYYINKSDSIYIEFYLDDSLIQSSDTVLFKMERPGPPLDLIDTINLGAVQTN